jgi:hypothetical protein
VKILTLIAANLGRIHWLNEKIEVFYDLWSSGYKKILPLLPAATAAAAEAVKEPATAAPESVQEPSE